MEHPEHNNQHPEGNNNGEAPAPVKAEAAAAVSAQQISLKVVNADGAEMFFKIKRGTQLKKLIDAYCKKQGISRGSVRFLFDGAPIDEIKTPEDLGMEDDDVIDAMVEQTAVMAQLTKDEVHTYAEAMIAAIKTPAFQERVRAAMCREPTPADAEAVMKRYEEVQADYFTNHYISEAGGIRSSISAGAESSGTSGAGGRAKSSQDASEALAQEVDNMRLQKASDAPRLDGVEIVEQLKNAVRVYKEEETVRLITELCLLIESQVTTLPATVPALKHLYSNSVYGSSRMEHAQAGGGANVLPVTHPSPEMMQMNMAMRTLNPKQRETVERVQRAMMNGSPPLPEDMQDMLLIQRQLAAFMQTMQRFGQMPSGRGRGSGGRGGCGGRGAQ